MFVMRLILAVFIRLRPCYRGQRWRTESRQGRSR